MLQRDEVARVESRARIWKDSHCQEPVGRLTAPELEHTRHKIFCAGISRADTFEPWNELQPEGHAQSRLMFAVCLLWTGKGACRNIPQCKFWSNRLLSSMLVAVGHLLPNQTRAM